jgi:hypothetical protein
MTNSFRRWLFLMRALLPMLVALSIWWPAFDHFRIDRRAPVAAVVAQLSREPSVGKLAEIAKIKFTVSLAPVPDQRARVAGMILDDRLEAPFFLSAVMPLRGWPADLSQGSSTFQLAMASFAVEDLLFDEFESSGDQRFYARARDRVLAFADWESQQRKPYGFLWNDHAIAARIAVLTRLWLTLRHDPAATSAQRASLLALVDRSGELLAKSSQFTVRTNHGVMQNLALLQITAAFPDLPKAAQWRNLALERLELQLAFYVSDEGVVLEHSSEYHVFGQELIAYAIQLARLNGQEPLPRLLTAYAGAKEFTRQLARPDGSLPLIGNTAGGWHTTAVSQAPHAVGSHLYPLSGYAIWWTGDPVESQTLVAWAKHDRHGHKHADEPSLHFWSRGMDWITATGYWPYDDPDYEQANGWAGSNAPHGKGEAAKSPRTVRLLGTAATGAVRLIDIENVRQSGLTVRRQVIQLAPEQLLVVDSVSGASAPVETIWTLDPRLNLQALGDQRFRSTPSDEGQALQIDLAHDAGNVATTTLYRGSRTPFAGWVVAGPLLAASALLVERAPGNSMTATLLTVANQAGLGVLQMAQGAQAENWSIEVQSPTLPLHVQRQGDRVVVKTNSGEATLSLVSPPSLETRQNTLRTAMSQAIQIYPPWRELGRFHQRLYIGIFSLWAGLEITLALLGRWQLRRRWMTAVVLGGWAGMAWWIHALYLGYPTQ